MSSPVAFTVVIDDQSVDFAVPAAPSVSVTAVTEPSTTVFVDDQQAVDVSVEAASVDVSPSIDAPFTVVTVEGPAGPTGPAGDGAFIAREIPSGTVDGTRTTFTLAHNFQTGTTSVYLNGLLEFFCNELSPNQIQFTDAPHPGDVIRVSYTVSS